MAHKRTNENQLANWLPSIVTWPTTSHVLFAYDYQTNLQEVECKETKDKVINNKVITIN